MWKNREGKKVGRNWGEGLVRIYGFHICICFKKFKFSGKRRLVDLSAGGDTSERTKYKVTNCFQSGKRKEKNKEKIVSSSRR